MSVNCTDVPADADRCLFVLIPMVCGDPAYQSSTFVNIDLRSKQGNYNIIIIYKYYNTAESDRLATILLCKYLIIPSPKRCAIEINYTSL